MIGPILIVDDEAAVTLALEGFFKSRGYSVLRAFYGDQAIEKIEKESPALVILDLQMPGVDGIAVLKKIRQAHPNVKTMVITGYSDDYQEELDRLKPEAIQMKPVSLEELTRSVEALIGDQKKQAAMPAAVAEKKGPVRLLFVENTADMYNRYLKPYFDGEDQPKYETAVASGPEEAFRLVESFKPHLILVDSARMPISIDAGKLASDLGKAPDKPFEVILYSFQTARDRKEDTGAEEVRHLAETVRQVVNKHQLFLNAKRG